jgi:dolichol kinase
MSMYDHKREAGKKIMLRKLFHLSGVVIPVIYLLTDKGTALIVTTGIFIVEITFEVLRIKGFVKVPLIEKNIKGEEINRLSGSFFYILSGLITIIFFEKNIAISSLFVLSIADPLSSLLGSRFGRVRFLEKSLEGTMTFFAASFLMLRIFSFPVPIAAACAFIASLTELFSSRFVDDNLSVPLVTALVLDLLTGL